MVGALPEYSSVDGVQNSSQTPQSAQRHLSGASTSALVYQLQQSLQMHNPGSAPLPTHSPYGPGFTPGQYPQGFIPGQGSQHANYTHFPAGQQRMPGPQVPYQGYHQPSQYMYYPAPYGPQGQYAQGFAAQGGQNQAMYGRRPSLTSTSVNMMGQGMEPQQDGIYIPGGRMGPEQANAGAIFGTSFPQGSGMPRSGPVSSIPRGPPRKPKQSGHALWVGNLPPGTTVISLKDHFSRDATKDIESLFLISKSNCAFVNYRTEASCTAAMHRFHDSRFNGVRLVCRLRRSSAPASGVPTGPSAMLSPQPAMSPPMSPLETDSDEVPADSTDLPTVPSNEARQSTAAEKYFIVKSLTLQDLELSVRNGIWATQSHNEVALNNAFKTAENVYLIFSANKSGEYFGYARMASPILDEGAELISAAPKPENIMEATDVPKSIPTPATEFAPKGKIIDDSARGTIFWEAELSDAEAEVEKDEQDDTEDKDKDKAPPAPPPIVPPEAAVAQSWGKPFKVEWISTNRLPFYRTRGLRNPWNANREVKIARDGTELESSVGERLIQMFHRLGPSSTAGAPMMQPQLGAPHIRPF
ncbi:hypothetical protein BS50DRAFT_506210 [Corynespora cassiicola Philippines]|uniref:YTH domain-containing protein n=1 Tax=Corynespora cassiicola Philippines TaxID=1448308 RepID=A0A2T2N5G8_CORCC|nr:hypothetical protein BS50DRAFT_506210 [Corynespora cassiicola Philippines]